jgi:PAS domain S-box-containing protein
LREPAGLSERLLHALLSISRSATLDEALEPLLDAALDLTKMDGGGVYRVEGDVAVLRHHRGLPEAFIRAVRRMPLAPPPVQIVLDQREPVEIAEISPVMRDLFRQYGIQHVFSFPLRARGILLGFLNVGSMRAEAPEKTDLQALWVLVKQIEALFFRLYSEKALRESEERQRRLLENLKGSHFIYVHDTQGVFQYLSESVTDILGYTPEEFTTHYDRYLTDHPVNQAVRRHTELSMQGIRQPPYEVNLWHKDGSSRWLEVQEVPVFDAAGRVVAVEGVAQDITERKRAEEALRRSEQLLKRSQEIAHLGSWELDLATDELTWSDEVYRIFGLKPPEFGGTYEAFLACVHPDDRQAVDKTYTGSIREGRDTYEIEHRIIRRDTGEVRLVHEKGENFRAADGRIVRSTGMVHDITERQRGEEALRESEERFHAFMDNSPAIAWMRDEQGRYVYLSRTYTRHSGKSLEECRGKTAFDLWPREIAEGFQKIDQEVLRTGRPLEAMEEVPTPEGRRSCWWNVKFPFRDASGRRFVGGIGVEITERRRAEEALRESEERYRTLWESALDGIVLYELPVAPQPGRFADVNDCLCRVLGYSREEFLKLSPCDIVADDAQEALPGLIAEVGRLGRLLFEITLVAKDGRSIPVEVNASVAQLGERRMALAVIRDVTERRRAAEALRASDERFRAFMNHSPAIAWMKDEQGRHVYLSEAYEKRFGVRLEDWRGKTDFDVWPREIAEEFRKNDLEVLRTGRTIEVVEESPAPDGTRWCWWNFKFPIQDASGGRFVAGIGVDITERKRAEEMLRQANERLEEQVQARTRELNLTIDRLQRAMEELTHRAGQLQKITLELSQAEDRERRRLAEFLHDDLQQILAAAKFHLSVLGGRIESQPAALEILAQIRNMLKDAIEKSRSLSHELGPPVLYGGALDAVFEWLAGQMERKHGLTVRVEVRRHANSRSEPVRSFLYRAAQEILFNAAKHAQVREARLRLQRVRQELWLTISDRGCGFDPASLAQTAGFGLLTIRERAELLGGRMTIKSAPGKGSIFFITVPDVGA